MSRQDELVVALGRLQRAAPLPAGAPPAGAVPAVRRAAVLMLFGHGAQRDGLPDVVLLRRADALRRHPGQIAFPGGTAEPGDAGPVGTALREAVEETGLDRTGVDVLGVLPPVGPLPTGFTVTPVLAWWRRPSPVDVVDPGESAEVWRVGMGGLADPERRGTVLGPRGYRGPGFLLPVPGPRRVLWGFTAHLLDQVLRGTGWERPWDRDRTLTLG